MEVEAVGYFLENSFEYNIPGVPKVDIIVNKALRKPDPIVFVLMGWTPHGSDRICSLSGLCYTR